MADKSDPPKTVLVHLCHGLPQSLQANALGMALEDGSLPTRSEKGSIGREIGDRGCEEVSLAERITGKTALLDLLAGAPEEGTGHGDRAREANYEVEAGGAS